MDYEYFGGLDVMNVLINEINVHQNYFQAMFLLFDHQHVDILLTDI